MSDEDEDLVTESSSCEEDAEEDESREEDVDAASGALRGVVGQVCLANMSAERQQTVQARATQVHRQVHFRDFDHWPAESDKYWLWSGRLVTKRRRHVARLIDQLKTCTMYAVPEPQEFITGMRHLNDQKQGERWDVVRAIASTKMHFLGLLQRKFEGVEFGSRKFFCTAFPSLKPASGGEVVCVHAGSPIWNVLREQWKVNNIGDFLKHLFNKHDGEARLIQGDWRPFGDEVDVRLPAFWSPQFARTDASRRWLAARNPNKWLTFDDVNWVLDQKGGETLLIRRKWAAAAASGARFEIRSGRVVTLAEMFYYGSELCTAYDIYKHYMDLPIFIHKHKRQSSRQRPRHS